MRRLSFVALCFFSPFALFAQKTADAGTVTFEKSTKSVVSYSGIGVEYYKPTDLYGGAASKGVEGSNGFGVSYELFSPIAPKTAVTLNSAAKFMTIDFGSGFKYDQSSIEMNLGLHQILAKGFYVKPELGLASITGTYKYAGQTEKATDFKGLFGAQTGFLFNLKSERPKFIDIGLMYQGYFGGGSYLGVAAKYLLGPKN